MIIVEILVPIFGAFVILNAAIHSKEKSKSELLIEIILGILICGCAIAVIIHNNRVNEKNEKDKQDLNNSISELRKQAKSISDNDSIFRKELHDSGFRRVGNSLVKIQDNSIHQNINQDNSNSNIYNISKEQNKLEPSKETVTDENNFTYTFSKNKLSVYPKEGIWQSTFIQIESNTLEANKKITDEADLPDPQVSGEEIFINRKRYIVHTISNFRETIYKNHPLVLDLSGKPNQFIIFGDFSNPTKRYIFKNGVVSWIPSRQFP